MAKVNTKSAEAMKYTALGAASLISGMTWGIKNKYAITPAFMLGWASIAYGLTDKFSKSTPMLNAGLAAIVTGGMLARSGMDWGILPEMSKFGKPIFMAGWMALSVAMAEKNKKKMGKTKAYAQAFGSAATVIAGVMMLRKQKLMGELPDLNPVIPPLVFSAGWAGVIATAGGIDPLKLPTVLPKVLTA